MDPFAVALGIVPFVIGTEQAFRDLDNQLVSVFVLRFSFRPLSLTILPNVSRTVVLARSMRFPQIGGWYPLRQFALVHIVMRHFVVLSVAEAFSDSHISVHHRS
jgi:hypothetical protein